MGMSFDLHFFIRLVFSFIDFTSFSLLSLSVYRIPILMYWKRLAVMQFVYILVMLFHELVLFNKDYYALSIALTAILLSTALLRIPFLYSSLVFGTGYLLGTLLQTLIVLFVTGTGIVSLEQMQTSTMTQNLLMLSNFAIVLCIIYFMEKKRLGFMFIMNRFRLQKRNLQLKDFFVAVFFICSISLVQVGIVSYFSKETYHNFTIIMGSMVVISLIGLYITYKFNMLEIDERFSSTIRRKKR